MNDRYDTGRPTDLVGVDNSSFRKGLVFGLTLAEVMLLLVFILLLALGALLLAAEQKARSLQDRAARAAAAESRLEQALSRFVPNTTPAEVQEWVRQLVTAQVAADEIKAVRDQLQRASEAMTRVDSAAVQSGLMPEPGMEPGQTAQQRAEAQERRWQETSQTIADAMSELRALRSANEALRTGDNSELARELTASRLEVERLQGTVAYAQRRLEDLGRGTERPACWANAQGRPEYIFQVDLSEAGITVRDRRLAHRASQQAQLPTRSIQFGRALSAQEFRAQTRPLFEWGEARECRFFVIAYDRTGATQKETFKQRLRVMEEHFYKFLAN